MTIVGEKCFGPICLRLRSLGHLVDLGEETHLSQIQQCDAAVINSDF